MYLKQIQSGGNLTDLAKKYSDDPGSKDSGGELGFAKRGQMVPEFDNAIFTQKIGDTKIVKSQYGFHIVQVEDRTPAHSQTLAEVLPTIQATLLRQKSTATQDAYAKALTSEAIKNGLDKTADAHHLQVVTTPPVNAQGVIPSLPDGSALITHGVRGEGGRSAAVGTDGRGLRGLPGEERDCGACADICGLEEPRRGRLSQRAGSSTVEPEDRGTGREGEGGERSRQGCERSWREREDQRPG